VKKVHFLGIGGISMSALAAILHSRGVLVSGSDLVANDQTRDLQNLGVKIHIGHRKSNSKHADLIIVNGAIADSNPELSNNIPVMSREQLLAEIEKTFKVRIAVAGSHGKSTTTAMIAAILLQANLDPTIHNGAVMHFPCGTSSNFKIGKSNIFLTEACEFKRSFLTLNPTIAVITNVDFDHVDCFKDLDDVKQSFDQFARRAQTVVRTHECPPIDFDLFVPGEHNRENARAAAQVGRALGISEQTIRKGLQNFRGIDRRFQKIARMQNCDIISDYAHHPAEIATTIQTAKSIYRRFFVIFQPHTYTRTHVLFGDFVKVLATCDCAVFKTYAAREKPIVGGRAKDLAVALGMKYIAAPETLGAFIKKNCEQYDAIILTGAGDMMYHLQLGDTMKEKIHPDYHEAEFICACGNKFMNATTKPGKEVKVEICNKCHPFYTGKQKIVDAAGRVDKFNKRYAKK
jgi:UDP-N-acetylmuramate--alanine ligase